MTRRRTIALIMIVGLAAAWLYAAKDKKPQADDRMRAVHALNRLSFGPRPGEVERVLAAGVDKWIEQQLHPERINDDALDARLAPLRTLQMDSREMVENFPPPRVVKALAAEQRDMTQSRRVIISDLQQGKLLRTAYSERQLQEVLTDFWFNHFNVFVGKGADRYLVTAYERDAIRPRVLGKFKDLLVATAKSPAMLFYLDNWQSVGPKSEFATCGAAANCGTRGVRLGRFGRMRYPRRRVDPERQAKAAQKRRGLNENYARELMELHTLGVDGGYSQKDVTEVARVFTGWTIREPRRGGEFTFNQRMHEPGVKMVLGHKIKEHGEDEAREVLEILSKHPATAKFVSRKLAQRFVADNPPQALVDSMAQTFRKSDGDLREVMRTMLKSPEFWSAEAYRAKVKTPLEFVVSAVRASGAEIENALPLAQALNRMGMPLYGAQPPTGYKNNAETWVNSSALLARMNFALALANGRLPGVHFDAQHLLGEETPGDPQRALGLLENALLAGDVSKQTHETILEQFADPQVTAAAGENGTGMAAISRRQPNVGVLAGLILGSPEFQRR